MVSYGAELKEKIAPSLVGVFGPYAHGLGIVPVAGVVHEKDAAVSFRQGSFDAAPAGIGAVGIFTGLSFGGEHRGILAGPSFRGPVSQSSTIAVSIQEDPPGQGAGLCRGVIHQPGMISHIPGPYLQGLVEGGTIGTFGAEINVFLVHFYAAEDRSFREPQQTGIPYGALAFAQVPEIHLPPVDMGLGPGPPDTVMMTVVGGLYAGQRIPGRRPEGMDVAAFLIEGIHARRRRLGAETVTQDRLPVPFQEVGGVIFLHLHRGAFCC